MRRFIIPDPVFADGELTVTGDLFHHMAHVLRLKRGSRICIADNDGREYAGVISQVERESISVVLEEIRTRPEAGTGPAITLFQGLPKGDKLEFILQKCTELGAAGIVPFVAARSVARVPAARLDEKLKRWRRILVEAARQSNRREAPDIWFAGGLSEALALVDHPLRLLFWEEEEGVTLKKALAGREPPERVAVIVGPEGGLTADEVASCVEHGFIPVSLGSRILRTETAGPAILAILQFHWGDMG